MDAVAQPRKNKYAFEMKPEVEWENLQFYTTIRNELRKAGWEQFLRALGVACLMLADNATEAKSEKIWNRRAEALTRLVQVDKKIVDRM